MNLSELPSEVLKRVQEGCVIPAQPLALDQNLKFDEKHQKALTRYYIDSGVGGIAVGVHSTQFEIRDPEINLFKPVLELASEVMDRAGEKRGSALFKVAGVCGKTPQAVDEAKTAVGFGYHACLLSLAAMSEESIDSTIGHCREISKIMPLIGFYLQPAVGGRALPYEFWRKFVEIENVIAIKMAPFNRYQTFDVVRALCESGRQDDVTLYTGNDDNIVVDLLSEYKINTSAGPVKVRIKGGLLGHWCVWTHGAVKLFEKIKSILRSGETIPSEMLTRAIEVTDCNAAFFDTANQFAGCIPGLHEVLKRQGLLKGTWCLNPKEVLSVGQAEEIDRVLNAYPHLNDDNFVKENLGRWLD